MTRESSKIALEKLKRRLAAYRSRQRKRVGRLQRFWLRLWLRVMEKWNGRDLY
jgi:hypothetical protein